MHPRRCDVQRDGGELRYDGQYDHRREVPIVHDAQRPASLKDSFDFVFLDAPPLSLMADTEELARMADASLLVVREHYAQSRDINDVIDVLNETGTAVFWWFF